MKARARLVTVAAVLAGMVWVLLLPAAAQTQFTNPTPITVPGLGPSVRAPWPGVPYPSNIVVSGLSGTVTDVTSP